MSSKSTGKYVLDILVVVVVVAVAYLGYKVVPTYIRHYRFKDGVHDLVVATTRQTNTMALKGDIRDVASRFDLELSDDDVVIERDAQGIDVHFEYQREISVPLRDKGIIFNFKVADSKEYNMW